MKDVTKACSVYARTLKVKISKYNVALASDLSEEIKKGHSYSNEYILMDKHKHLFQLNDIIKKY